MTTTNDVVLIHLEDTPVSFARVESIQPDAKKDWYQIKLLMLQIPTQVVTWILKADYINGEDFFMNGKRMRLEKVESPVENPLPDDIPKKEDKSEAEGDETVDNGNVISLADFKKN